MSVNREQATVSSIFEDEEQYKEYLINSISSKKMFGFLAFYTGLEQFYFENPSDKKIEEWKSRLLSLDLDKFLKKVLPFITAGSFTTNIFILSDCCAESIEETFSDKDKLSIILTILGEYFPKVIKVKDNTIVMALFYPESPSYHLMQSANNTTVSGISGKPRFHRIIDYEEVHVIFRPKLNTIEIRSSNDKTVRNLLQKLKDIFSIDARILEFSKEEKDKVLDWARVTNSNIRFESGAISSSRYTSITKKDGTRADLKEAEIFQDAIKEGNIVSVYINVPEDYIFKEKPLKKKSSLKSKKPIKETESKPLIGPTIGFSVNFNRGKIFFQSHVPEVQAWMVISYLINLVDITSLKPKCTIAHEQKYLEEFEHFK